MPKRRRAEGHGQERGELALIQRIRQLTRRGGPAAGNELQLGIGDDCAILRPGRGEEIVVTTDFSLEGRHFRRDWHSAESIGHRALARGLSDIAAMGARPIAAFLSLALPRSAAENKAWVDAFLRGLLALAQRTNVPLAGGDTAQSPGEQVLTDIVLLGAVAQGRALRRDGARVGDRLYVTGTLGGSAAQLQHLAEGGPLAAESATGPHLFPEPRLVPGRWLVEHRRATAAIDISDGLSTDLDHLCEASNVAAEVDAPRLPLHPLLADLKGDAPLHLALHGGEDYELLFTAAATARLPTRIGDVRVTEIGLIVARGRGRPAITLIGKDKRRKKLEPAGWEHFR